VFPDVQTISGSGGYRDAAIAEIETGISVAITPILIAVILLAASLQT
jgi:hypothetical protein